MWTKKRTKFAKPGPGLFAKLINEILSMVVREVWLTEGVSGLLKLSLVSRRLYLHVCPHLYCYIRLNLNRASHIRLLKRLARPDSRLPCLIRTLSFEQIQEDHTALLHEISRVMTGLEHLTALTWLNGTMDVPRFILDELHARFPKAKLLVRGSNAQLQALPEELLSPLPFPFRLVLAHSAASNVTNFTFTTRHTKQLYNDFKADLVCMLVRNRVLRTLQLHLSACGSISFPEMLETFRTCELPQPHWLLLVTSNLQLFTRRELSAWGAKGGWQNLNTLSLDHARLLVSFVGLIPALIRLTLTPRNRDDYDQLEEYLDRFNLDQPFGLLRELEYRGRLIYPGVTPMQNNRAVPWCILHKAPKLKDLDIVRALLSNNVIPGPNLHVPTPSDVANIRSTCPDLETLAIDVALQGPYAKWPLEILTELARFEKSINLILYLHHQQGRRASFMVNWCETLAVMRHIRKEREHLNLPLHWPFRVCFKDVNASKDFALHWTQPDYTVWIPKDTTTCSFVIRHKYKQPEIVPDKMSLRDLRAKRPKGLAGKIGWDRKGYREEIKRREQQETLSAGFSAGASLYDLWLKQ